MSRVFIYYLPFDKIHTCMKLYYKNKISMINLEKIRENPTAYQEDKSKSNNTPKHQYYNKLYITP